MRCSYRFFTNEVNPILSQPGRSDTVDSSCSPSCSYRRRASLNSACEINLFLFTIRLVRRQIFWDNKKKELHTCDRHGGVSK